MKRAIGILIIWVVGLAIAGVSQAGVVVYENKEQHKKIEIGARIQLQYSTVDVDGGESSDTVFFRRLRPYISGTVTENWYGKLQFDFGKASDGNEVAVKDAYMQYKGWDNVSMFIGSSKSVFSREFLTSSKRQQIVERGFVGDHNFGTPDRMLGIRFDGHNESKKIHWKANFGSQALDPDAKKLDFDSPANNAADWNEGWVSAARVDFFPRGAHKFDQGDFHSDEMKYSFSLAGYIWENDGDNNSWTDDLGTTTNSKKPDIDSATGFELSAGLRGFGWSADAEYHRVSAETVDSTFTGGLYEDGSTDIDQFHLEGGYVLSNGNFEVVGKYEFQDADHYEDAWEAVEVGFNYFYNKHKTKIQFGYRMGENVNGFLDQNRDTATLQFQFVF